MVYLGESARNLFTKSSEHDNNFIHAENQSVKHKGEEPNFKATVTVKSRDCLTRQVRKAVLLTLFRGGGKNACASLFHQITVGRQQ